jgi:IS30 family transposase
MGQKYTHLSAEERAMIEIEVGNGSSLRSVARRLGRQASSVSRELSRNRSESSPPYSGRSAGAAYRERRRRSVRRRRLVEGTPLYQRVYTWLVHRRWSPQQIAARLRHMYPDDPQWHISHETLYAAIYTHPRGALKQGMVDALRQSKPQRGRRRTTAVGASFVPEALRIVHRPEEIATRLLPGHWEGDFIKGAFNRSAVGTLVERKTRFVVLCKMEGCTAQAALEGFTRQMKKLPAFLRESLTYDRGSEMALSCRTVDALESGHLVCRSARALAARQQREHQRIAAPIPAQGHRPVTGEPDPPQRHCPAAQRSTASNAGVADSGRNDGQGNGRIR